MKQRINFYVTIPLVFAILMSFMACLNPLDFDPDSVYNNNVTGDINTTDVTSAVLMLINRSKTVDVTSVTITQPEWVPSEKNPWAQAPSISFTNRPKRLERKAQYLAPSDKSYQIVIDYAFDANDKGPAGTGSKTLTVPLPLPRQVVEIFIYRNKDGVTIVDREVTDPDLNDTGNPPAEDPSKGEGSSPAVIPPGSRDRMATFVVINRTNSQVIDSVDFKMGGAGYTIGKIGVTDKQSIALGQGTWETTLKYKLNNSDVTLGPKSSVIVPSNDPQATKEHYLFFYKTNRGDYNISQEWPPYPNDADEEDLLPPDINNKGRGLIKIINNSYSMAKLVNIVNLRGTSKDPMAIHYQDFSPPVPVQYAKTGYVNVVGTEEFPIDAHEGYLIQVSLEANDNIFTVERKAYIKDQVVTIVIDAEDLKETNAVGAKVTLQNNVISWPINITSMIVRNKASAKSSVYGVDSWEPSGVIEKGRSADQYVISSAGMPIIKGGTFEAVITVQSNNRTGVITKDFSPAELYSELPPNQNTRILAISDSDVPNSLKETFEPVTSITLSKDEINVELMGTSIVSGGRLNLNNYIKVNPDKATVQGPVIWEIDNSGNALWNASTWSGTNGDIEISGRKAPSSGSSTTTIQVKATIKNAAGTLLSKSDFTQTFPITVNFFEPPSKSDVWANSINFTASDLTIKVGDHRNLSSLLEIKPFDTTVTKEDINWTNVGSSVYFDLDGPSITGKAVGTGVVRVVLPASKNGGTELKTNLNVTVISDITETFEPVTSITLSNSVINVDLQGGIVVAGGRLNLNNYTAVSPSDATVQGPIIWKIDNSGNALWNASTWSGTNGDIEISGRKAPSSGPSTTIIQVKATIKNAAGTLLSKSDFTQTFNITVNFSEVPPSKSDVWANSINFTAADLTIRVGDHRNLSSLLEIKPLDSTVTKDDINWTIEGSVGSSGSGPYFDLVGPSITGKAVGSGIVKVVLPASKNGGTELKTNLKVTVISDIDDIPSIDDGRILPPAKTGDSENWVEIARNGDYSLIVRAKYISISETAYKDDPYKNSIPYGSNNAYGNSWVRRIINAWFNSNNDNDLFPNAEKLSSGARLRNYTVQNDAKNILGNGSNKVGLTDGFSKPTSNHINKGDDVAFALSYGEAANFCSTMYFLRDSSPAYQNSSAIAAKNHGKIKMPGNTYGMWLRSPGDGLYTATASAMLSDGKVFQFHLYPTGNEYGLVYPALWVHQDIFK